MRRPTPHRPRRSRPRKSSPTATAGGAERHREHCGHQLHRPRQAHGTREIRDSRRRAVPERRPYLQLVGVLGGPAESHVQRTRECRLHHASVRAGVARRVTAPGAYRTRR